MATRDPRDVMIDLALHFDFARCLGGSPPNIFNEVADRLPECEIAVTWIPRDLPHLRPRPTGTKPSSHSKAE
jgi:hypothetical protein